MSKDISIRALKSGMLSKCSEDEIEEKIKVFLTPAEGTKTHGRAIFRNQAINCELDIEELDTNSELWRLIYELYIRTNNFVSTETAKCIENSDIQFIASVP